MANSVFLNLSAGQAFIGQQIGPAASNTALPPFSFLGDLTTGYGSSATAVLDLVITGTSRLSVSATAVTSTLPFSAPSVAGGTTPASSGALRIPNGNQFNARNAANNGDVPLIFADGSNFINVGSVGGFALDSTGAIRIFKAITTAGFGAPVIVAATRVTAQNAANPSIATYTVGAADGSFDVSANLNCTVTTSLITTLTCTYTDESNTGRTMVFPVAQLAGSFIAAGAITGLGAWETPIMHIRCKAATVITILTSAGTFTGVTYTAEGVMKQTA